MASDQCLHYLSLIHHFLIYQHVVKWTGSNFTTSEALPGFLGNRGMMSFISGVQENTSLKMKGKGEQR